MMLCSNRHSSAEIVSLIWFISKSYGLNSSHWFIDCSVWTILLQYANMHFELKFEQHLNTFGSQNLLYAEQDSFTLINACIMLFVTLFILGFILVVK